jgi:hypothetical protein
MNLVIIENKVKIDCFESGTQKEERVSLQNMMLTEEFTFEGTNGENKFNLLIYFNLYIPDDIFRLRSILVSNGRSFGMRHTYIVLWEEPKIVLDDMEPLSARSVGKREKFVVEYFIYSKVIHA